MRSTVRHPCELAIRVLHQGCITSARLLDISRSGARVIGPDHLRPDTAIILLCAGIEIRGWTRWVRGAVVGVEFVQPITAAQLTLVLSKADDSA
ncbi:MAG: PilZ domain-containing protein [Rhodobacteraceae bacterium]|nr:PilZ domain-containing protein [Paracoccaceae bacterium]